STKGDRPRALTKEIGPALFQVMELGYHLPDNRNGERMANLILELLDDLVRRLEGIAAPQRKSLQQLAVERLKLLVESNAERRAASPAAILRVINEPPHLDGADVDALDAAIAAGRLPVRMH